MNGAGARALSRVRLRPWRALDRETGLALFDSNVPEFFHASEKDDFLALVDDLPGPYFVLEADGVAVGCGGYAGAGGDPAVVSLCWGMIRGDLHRRGFGNALLAARLAAIAAEPAYREVRIETTPFSCGFYRRHGFIERRRAADGFAPGYDLIEMALDLRRHRASPD